MDQLASFLQRFGSAPYTGATPEDFDSDQPAPDALGKFLSGIQGTCGELEIIKFYNGTEELRYDKANHIYYKLNPELGNLIPLDGTTSVCHIVDRSVALVPWAAKKVIEKLLTLIPTYVAADGVLRVREMTFEEFTKIALDAKTAPRDELEEAGDIGHMAHAWLEKYILAVIAKDVDKQRQLLTEMCKDERATNCCRAALDWIRAHNVRWQITERKIYSREHGYAGTTDGRCYVDSCSDPLCCAKAFKDHLSIIDWKSSNFLYIEYLFQTAAYEHAEKEELGLPITDRWILRLGKEDGKFEPWHLGPEDFEEDFAGFLACLRLHRLVKSVEERMGVQKKNKRAAKKEAKRIAKELAEATDKVQKAIAKATKRLQKEVEKAELKRVADEAKAKKKADKEQQKTAIKAAKKTKAKIENEPQVLTARVAELSPRVAALLEEAHEEQPTVQLPAPDPQVVTLPAPAKAVATPAQVYELRVEESIQEFRFQVPEENL